MAAVPYGIGYFTQSLAAVLALTTFNSMAVLNGAVDNVQLTITIDAWHWLWPTAGNFSLVIGTETFVVTAGHTTTILTVTRASPVNHANASPINWLVFPAARIIEGSYPTDQITLLGRTFMQRITIDGPAIKIPVPSIQNTDDKSRHGEAQVTCVLFFGVLQNTPQSLVDLMSLIDIIRNVLFLQTNWPSPGPSSITNFQSSQESIDYTQSPAFGSVQLVIHTRF